MFDLKPFATATAVVLCLSTPALAQQQTTADTQPPKPQQTEAATQQQPAQQDGQAGATVTTQTVTVQPPKDEAAPATDTATTQQPQQGQEVETVTVQPDAGDGQVATAEGGAPLTPVTEQEESQFLADRLLGTNVRNDADESIGEVEDLVITKDGTVESVVVSVGGFLGIGDKEVALPWNELKREQYEGDMILRASATEEQLEGMPEFKTFTEVRMEEEAARAQQETGQIPTAAETPAPARTAQ